ncbi:MAG TPA: hypothetical protein VJP77_09605 [Planctomycetota bacterium]|nr:hypothetical protein [Planctomycetota bacterium]
MPLKPQDLLVCLALAARGPAPWTYAELGTDLGLSASEANKAVERAVAAGLLAPALEPRGKPIPVRATLLEFLAHGVRHAFFARPGRMVRGMPTAHSAPPLKNRLRGGDEPPLVWPDAKGEQRGQAVDPLYPSVPDAARRHPGLYELLALTDAVRCGRARERKLAVAELEKRLTDGR